MNILFLRGISDENRVEPYLSNEGKIVFRIDGSSSVFRHMYSQNPDAKSIILFGRKIDQKNISLEKKPDVVFNEISDPDSHKDSLARCEKLCTNIGVPVINHPGLIRRTTRDQIAQRLGNIPDVTMPATVRCCPKSPDEIHSVINQENLNYPVIARLAGAHGGTSSVLIRSSRDTDRLHVFPFDGRDFYLTDYVDYQDSDGLYRKYRIVVISGRSYFRHVMISDDWMVHASSLGFARQRDDLMLEMRQRRQTFDDVLAPKISHSAGEIYRRVELDYFGVDCHIDSDGKMLIFEVNANMNVLDDSARLNTSSIDTIKNGIHQLIKSKAAGR